DCSQSAYILRPVGPAANTAAAAAAAAAAGGAEAKALQLPSPLGTAETPAGAGEGAGAGAAAGAAAGVRTGARVGAIPPAQGSPLGSEAKPSPKLNPNPKLIPKPKPNPAAAAAAAVSSWDQEAAPLSYEVACAIEVSGTVGSLAVSYGPLLGQGGGSTGGAGS
ncbi:unnamed protein product, partial [Laminaria digitata]